MIMYVVYVLRTYFGLSGSSVYAAKIYNNATCHNIQPCTTCAMKWETSAADERCKYLCVFMCMYMFGEMYEKFVG